MQKSFIDTLFPCFPQHHFYVAHWQRGPLCCEAAVGAVRGPPCLLNVFVLVPDKHACILSQYFFLGVEQNGIAGSG